MNPEQLRILDLIRALAECLGALELISVSPKFSKEGLSSLIQRNKVVLDKGMPQDEYEALE